MQQASLETVDEATCKKMNARLGVSVTDTMLCAGNQNSRKSGCHGDSGGPFVCQDKSGTWYLHGIVSWGSPSCNSKYAYSVFSKVAHFRHWMDRYIWY